MKARLDKLKRSEDAATAVEFALIAPLFLMLILGTWNAGVAYFAYNGIRNAVETGARLATVYPRPTEAQLKLATSQAYFGPGQGTLTGPVVTYATENGAQVVNISMSYTHTTFVPFLDLPPVTMTHQRTSYLAPQGTTTK